MNQIELIALIHRSALTRCHDERPLRQDGSGLPQLKDDDD
jgi:hypothetical protein